VCPNKLYGVLALGGLFQTTDLGVRGSTPLGRANLFRGLDERAGNRPSNRKHIGSIGEVCLIILGPLR
jgi:hypothetical protein